MNNLEILIDDREKAVIPHFKALQSPNPGANIPFRVERLTVGDYAILYQKKILFTIERKTWVDLAASFKDQRSKNVQNLIDLRAKIGCIIIYLIEGPPLPKHKTRFARIPYKNLRSHLDHLAFRDGIHIMHSKDEQDSACRINEIAKNYMTIHPLPIHCLIAASQASLENKNIATNTESLADENNAAGHPNEANSEISSNNQTNQVNDSLNTQDPLKILLQSANPTEFMDGKTKRKEARKKARKEACEAKKLQDQNTTSNTNHEAISLQVQIDAENPAQTIQNNEEKASVQEIASNPINGGNDDQTELLKAKKIITPTVILYRLWCALPGVTTATASLFVDKYTILDYLLGRVSVEEVAMMRYPSGVIIGEDRAKKMLKICNMTDTNNKPAYIKLFEQIPLISKGTAIKLLKTFGIKEILEGKISREKIAEIPRSAKKRIGAKAALNIFMHFGIKAKKQA